MVYIEEVAAGVLEHVLKELAVVGGRGLARQLVDDIVLVSEDDIRQSMVALIQRNKVITEGAGALACAALLSGKLDSYIQNRKTVSLISGGNIDLSRVSQITGFVDA